MHAFGDVPINFTDPSGLEPDCAHCGGTQGPPPRPPNGWPNQGWPSLWDFACAGGGCTTVFVGRGSPHPAGGSLSSGGVHAQAWGFSGPHAQGSPFAGGMPAGLVDANGSPVLLAANADDWYQPGATGTSVDVVVPQDSIWSPSVPDDPDPDECNPDCIVDTVRGVLYRGVDWNDNGVPDFIEGLRARLPTGVIWYFSVGPEGRIVITTKRDI